MPFGKDLLGRLLRPDIVQFHFACLGTEIFLRELKAAFHFRVFHTHVKL